MTAWISLVPADLEDYLAASQLAALRESALGDTQTDPVPVLIADIIARVRAEIAAAPGNILSATSGTVPPSLRSATAMMVLEQAQTRLPGLSLTKDQQRLASEARALMARVARGEVGVETPDDPATSAPSSTSGTIRVLRSRPPLRGDQIG